MTNEKKMNEAITIEAVENATNEVASAANEASAKSEAIENNDAAAEILKKNRLAILIAANEAEKQMTITIEKISKVKSNLTTQQKKKANALDTTFDDFVNAITAAKTAKTQNQLDKAASRIETHRVKFNDQYTKLIESINESVKKNEEAEKAAKERQEKQEAAKKAKEAKEAEKAAKIKAEFDAKQAEYNLKFPVEFNLNGIIAKRLTDGASIDKEGLLTFEADSSGNYAMSIAKIALALHNTNYKIALAFRFTKDLTCKRNGGNHPSIYENYNYTPLPSKISKFPFELDLQGVYYAMLNNSYKLLTTSIYTEFAAAYSFDYFKRDKKSMAFKLDKYEFEIYILDYSGENINLDFDSVTGFLRIDDKTIDEIEAATNK